MRDGGPRPALVVQGFEVEGFESADWDYVLSHEGLVFARMQPEHKEQVWLPKHRLPNPYVAPYLLPILSISTNNCREFDYLTLA